MKRQTIQKALVFGAVSDMDIHPTAEQIFDAIAEKYPGISRGTVYRNLNSLADDGLIRRVQVANAPDRYDHTVYNHAHFLCNKCGKVFDYELSYTVKAEDEINPGMMVLGYELVFSGICANCKEETDG